MPTTSAAKISVRRRVGRTVKRQLERERTTPASRCYPLPLRMFLVTVWQSS